MTTRDIVFTAVGAVTALSALLSVTTKQVVHAALWLLVSLGSLAGAYLVLGQGSSDSSRRSSTSAPSSCSSSSRSC